MSSQQLFSTRATDNKIEAREMSPNPNNLNLQINNIFTPSYHSLHQAIRA
jgi:hypothetical protein